MSLLGLALCVAAVTTGPLGRARAGRISCAEVVKRANQIAGHPGKLAVDPVLLGRKFGVEARWIERCMQVYGRRLGKPVPLHEESKEDLEERWESEEVEEYAPEEERGYVPPLAEERRRREPRPTPMVDPDREDYILLED